MKACVSIAMDEGILARIAHRKAKPMTRDTSHKKRNNDALKKDDASLVKNRGTLKESAQIETPETKLKKSQTELGVGKI